MGATLQMIKRSAKHAGIVLDRYLPFRDKFKVLERLCEDHNIELILDVGANDGGFARDMFEAGWGGRILSIEPLEQPWQTIREASLRNADRWTVSQRMCLGPTDSVVEFNVAANGVSSSVLDVLPRSTEANQDTRYVEKVRVPMRKLDTLANADNQLLEARSFALKLDVQGYEGAVLDGATRTLPRIPVVMLEMSLTPLYAGAPAFNDLYSRMIRMGYSCAGIFPGFTDRSSMRMLQVDGVFERGQAS